MTLDDGADGAYDKGVMNMKILMVESSPHKQGSSNLLAAEFQRGAEEAGHEVEVFDAAKADIHPCLGCDYCGMAGPCVQKDDMEGLKDRIRRADMVVFVTPLYYFGFSTQLKMVIDRFYSFNGGLTSMHLKTALIVAAWDSNSWTMENISAHYQTLVKYLNFDDQGMILGKGCGNVPMTRRTEYPRAAYEMGRSLR